MREVLARAAAGDERRSSRSTSTSTGCARRSRRWRRRSAGSTRSCSRAASASGAAPSARCGRGGLAFLGVGARRRRERRATGRPTRDRRRWPAVRSFVIAAARTSRSPARSARRCSHVSGRVRARSSPPSIVVALLCAIDGARLFGGVRTRRSPRSVRSRSCFRVTGEKVPSGRLFYVERAWNADVPTSRSHRLQGGRPRRRLQLPRDVGHAALIAPWREPRRGPSADLGTLQADSNTWCWANSFSYVLLSWIAMKIFQSLVCVGLFRESWALGGWRPNSRRRR